VVAPAARVGVALQRVERERAVQRAGVGVEQQLGRVEALALVRRPAAVRAQPVALAGAQVGDEAVEDVAGARGQGDALDLGGAGRVGTGTARSRARAPTARRRSRRRR